MIKLYPVTVSVWQPPKPICIGTLNDEGKRGKVINMWFYQYCPTPQHFICVKFYWKGKRVIESYRCQCVFPSMLSPISGGKNLVGLGRKIYPSFNFSFEHQSKEKWSFLLVFLFPFRSLIFLKKFRHYRKFIPKSSAPRVFRKLRLTHYLYPHKRFYKIIYYNFFVGWGMVLISSIHNLVTLKYLLIFMLYCLCFLVYKM